MRIREFVDDLLELDITTSKNVDKIESYKHVNIYATNSKVMNKNYIAYAIHPRTREELDKKAGNTQEEAIQSLKDAIDSRDEERSRVSRDAIIDFNVRFATSMLKDPTDEFYAKIVQGPKLVIAGEEMEQYPDLLQSEGFKKSFIRNVKDSEGTTKLPAVQLSGKNAQKVDIVDNGRYVIAQDAEDKDGNRVFDLQFDSVVDNPREKMRIPKPALTIGTKR